MHGIGLRMRDDIIGGALQFGNRVTIDALATRHGVSHMPVREARRELRGEGPVVIEPNRGERVRTIDVCNLDQALWDLHAQGLQQRLTLVRT